MKSNPNSTYALVRSIFMLYLVQMALGREPVCEGHALVTASSVKRKNETHHPFDTEQYIHDDGFNGDREVNIYPYEPQIA